MHQSFVHFIPLFKYDHLPPQLQKFSKPFCDTAFKIMANWPANRETTVCLRKLLEAKDAGVRAAGFANKGFDTSAVEERIYSEFKF